MCDICGRKTEEVEVCVLCAIDKFLEITNAIYYFNSLLEKEEKEMVNIAVCHCGRYWAEDNVWKEPTRRVKLKILQIKLGLTKDIKIHTMFCDICREKGDKR